MREFAPFLLLFAGIIVLLYLNLARYKKEKARAFLTLKNLRANFLKRSWLAYYVTLVCLIAGWIMLVMTLIYPAESPERASKSLQTSGAKRPNIDEVAFILDVSSSMGAKDSSINASRLARAKEIIESIMENLGGLQVSLTLFGENASCLVPDTLDYLFLRILLDSVELNDNVAPGTNLLAMCEALKKRYVDAPYKKQVLAVLLTDGEDTALTDSSGQNTIVQSMPLQNIRWNIVGLGSVAGSLVPGVTYEGKPVTSSMQKALLAEMARHGRGHFFQESQAPLNEIIDDILADIAASEHEDIVSAAMQNSMQARLGPQPQPLTISLYLLLFGALLFIFATLALPQYETEKQRGLRE